MEALPPTPCLQIRLVLEQFNMGVRHKLGRAVRPHTPSSLKAHFKEREEVDR